MAKKKSRPKKNFDEVVYPFIGNDLSDKEKIAVISKYFEKILITLGLDITDESLVNTPYRYASMLVDELFEGLDPNKFPRITAQRNTFKYNQMVIESNIAIKSMCEHHFIPFMGNCYIAYIPHKKVIGLSKLNRIAQYFSRRPQVQERLTKQIKECLVGILETENVAVVVDALHLCVRMRGIEDRNAFTRSMDFGGLFLKSPHRQEFLNSIPKLDTNF
jgi:GTP cyclohydrolase I